MNGWQPYGDGWFAEFGSLTEADRWEAHLLTIGLEVRRGWSSLLVQGAPDAVRAAIAGDPGTPTGPAAAVQPVVVAVVYDGDDLPQVAAAAGCSVEEVIARHTAPTYRVVMLGFTAGFPYLAGLDPTLQLPRRSTPRTRVPAGSVAIAGAQCGIYPTASPGGWHLLGRTDAVLFDVRRDPPVLLRPGTTVRFRAVG